MSNVVKLSIRIPVYYVIADIHTGDWLNAPEATGETTCIDSWSKQEDTSDFHFTTYKVGKTTCALAVQWVH